MQASPIGSVTCLDGCTSGRTAPRRARLEVVGERWSLLIIRNAAFADMTRFSEFERRLGVAPNVLAKRLADFVAEGLMEAHDPTPTPDHRGRSYRLTPKGRELGEVVMALTAWGDRWAAPDGPPVRYEHEGCGGTVTTSTLCSACGQHPEVADVVACPGPGATAAQRDAMLARRISQATAQ